MDLLPIRFCRNNPFLYFCIKLCPLLSPEAPDCINKFIKSW